MINRIPAKFPSSGATPTENDAQDDIHANQDNQIINMFEGSEELNFWDPNDVCSIFDYTPDDSRDGESQTEKSQTGDISFSVVAELRRKHSSNDTGFVMLNGESFNNRALLHHMSKNLKGHLHQDRSLAKLTQEKYMQYIAETKQKK
jgi:hypothetical protein